MGILTSLAFGVVVKLMADEAKASLPSITQLILDFAVSRLPADQREQRKEEWAADLESFPGDLARLLWALGLPWAAVKIRIDYRGLACGHLSRWSRSSSKRLFDLSCVLLALPAMLPLFLVIGLAVRLTSRGPVLFRQTRAGRNGKQFAIFKFRTMPVHGTSTDWTAITTNMNRALTLVGPFLRRYKLDELPELVNVLLGDMSLVGPRPKAPQRQATRLNCRPGITGNASVVFANEEAALAHVPTSDLERYYREVVVPLKQLMDERYMACATFTSDLKLIVASAFRSWSDSELVALLAATSLHLANASVIGGANSGSEEGGKGQGRG